MHDSAYLLSKLPKASHLNKLPHPERLDKDMNLNILFPLEILLTEKIEILNKPECSGGV